MESEWSPTRVSDNHPRMLKVYGVRPECQKVILECSKYMEPNHMLQLLVLFDVANG